MRNGLVIAQNVLLALLQKWGIYMHITYIHTYIRVEVIETKTPHVNYVGKKKKTQYTSVIIWRLQ